MDVGTTSASTEGYVKLYSFDESIRMSPRSSTTRHSRSKCSANASQSKVDLASQSSLSDITPCSGIFEWKGIANNKKWEVHRGDAEDVLKKFADGRFACVVTSPPYFWQRDYQIDGQLGKEPTVAGYVKAIADVMDGVRRVLSDRGVLFLNLGDTYYSGRGEPKGKDPKSKARRFGLRAVDASGLGVPKKTAIGIPWRVALEMISRKWVLRSPIVWRREKCLGEPTAHDRPWRSYEFVFLFSKTSKYHFDRKELGGDEDVWTISNRPRSSNGLHSAAFPDELVQKCLKIGCKPGGEVLDPFAGSGTVVRVATGMGHPAVGVDLSDEYCKHIVKQLELPTG